MPVANTKNLRTSIMDFLKARPNNRFDGSGVAAFFGCSIPAASKILYDLYKDMKIRMSFTRKTGRAYWFESAATEPVEYSPPAWFRREWKMPSQMMERVQEVQERRAAFPSKHV